MGRKTSALSVYSRFARKDVSKPHPMQAGEAAHPISTSSIDRAAHLTRASAAHWPTPAAPPSQGGERRGLRPGIRVTNSEGNARSRATPTLPGVFLSMTEPLSPGSP